MSQHIGRNTHLSLVAAGTFLAGLLLFPNAHAQQSSAASTTIPSGTILPIQLNTSVSASKSQPGELVSGRIMQDVPLADGRTIREGSRVLGHVVNVSNSGSANAQVSLQFDTLLSSGQSISIKTNLRAIAGYMAVVNSRTPDGPVSAPTSHQQIGGDVAYTSGGPVTTASGAIVGHSVYDGVLVQAADTTRDGKECRGVVSGNDNPAALWVFSSDACGAYGLSNVHIAHVGRTEPAGVIVLASSNARLKIPSGSGLLLRVQ